MSLSIPATDGGIHFDDNFFLFLRETPFSNIGSQVVHPPQPATLSTSREP